MKRGPKGGTKKSITSMIGQRYARWLVLSYGGTAGVNLKPHMLCKCDCGTQRLVQAEYLRSGQSKSCGCLRSIIGKEANTTHGQSRVMTGAYRSWKAMFSRCYAPRNVNYKYYGGIGIVVCDRWRKFENFYADIGDRPEGKTLDRINPYGNYEPSNCRWATVSEQNLNKRKQ